MSVGTHTFHVAVTDVAGNTGNASSTFSVPWFDTTPPEIEGTSVEGWSRTNVVVHFSASDTESGIYSVTPDVTVTNEGENIEVMGIAFDV